MKRAILILIILFSLNAIGQDKKATESQNHWFLEAEKDVDSFNIREAFYAYQFSYKMLPNNELGKKAKTLSDSLRRILRKELIKDLTGNWKLKIYGRIKSESDRNHYERLGKFLKIRNDSIFYYKNRVRLILNKPKSIQKIEFCDLETTFPHYADITHENNKIWSYHIDSTMKRLIIEENGELSKDGKSRSWVGSHPSGYTYYRIK